MLVATVSTIVESMISGSIEGTYTFVNQLTNSSTTPAAHTQRALVSTHSERNRGPMWRS